jgi:pimeloyl-ACP methyl ester carboxylesterase
MANPQHAPLAAAEIVPAATLDPAPPPGGIRFLSSRSCPGMRYFLSLPPGMREDAPVLVSVHGISRNARAHAEVFTRLCADLGCAVIAPLFTKDDFRRYQQLGYDRAAAGARADLALNAVLDEVGEMTGAATDRVYMFGFSGGGQFVHRYALVHPDRVMAAALGAPGWYSFPDRDTPFPRGLRGAGRRIGFRLKVRGALRVPMAVFVGARDTLRDDTLNTTARIDAQQGHTRPERARRWVAAMRAAAAELGLDTPYAFEEVAGCGHSFVECMIEGRMDRRALQFMIEAAIAARRPGLRPQRSTGNLPFLV